MFSSMNVDECMSNAYEKIFSIIVSYFSDELKRVVVHHYNSKALVTVNAATLFDHIKSTYDGDRIPMKNISNLSDSTNYMRGKLSVLEKRLRNEVPHLLDIDGDICHHAHNMSRIFCLRSTSTSNTLLTIFILT